MNREMPSRLHIALDRRYLIAKRKLFRISMKLRGNLRPSSYPYISSDSFRAFADHVQDKTHIVDPALVKKGDFVLINNDFLEDYLTTIHKKIPHPYVILGYNDDTNIDASFIELLDNNVYRLYAQDLTCEHPKITAVPMGLENLHYYAAGITSLYKNLAKKINKETPEQNAADRRSKIFFKFNLRTNPVERGECMDYLLAHPLAETLESKVSPILHSKLLSEYKFVASPPGHTVESGRTWEALYLKTIPIVKNNAATRAFKSYGLPIWIINDWHELDGLTAADLDKKYDELLAGAQWETLWMDYWMARIRADQKEIRESK